MRLIQMSISAGILIAVILLLRSAGRKIFSARFLYLLWFVVLARMLLPVELPVKLPDIGIEASWRSEELSHTVLVMEQDVEAVGPAGYDAGDILQYKWLAFWIWADICLGLMIFFAGSYIRQVKRLDESIPLKDSPILDQWKAAHPMRQRIEFRVFDRTQSPVTCGVLNPRIIFPRNMDMENVRFMEHILRHEYVHIRRFDNLWKIIMLAAVCVHWFNPLAWVMWYCFNRDLELACDQSAVRGLNPDGRRSYAMTLLWFAEKNQKALLLYNGFGKSAVKERITVLMEKNRRTRTGIICSVLVFAMSMTVFASVDRGAAGNMGSAEKSPAQMLSEAPQFKEYEAAGLRYSPEMDTISYNNQIVGYFKDEYAMGISNQMDDMAGSLCLEAVRDQNGKLDHFTEVEETDYLKHASVQERRMAGERAYIREYGAYGLTYDKETGYLSFNGKLVDAIQDTGGCGILVGGAGNSSDAVGLIIERDENETITGIKTVQLDEMSDRLQQAIGVGRTEDGWSGN